MRIGARNTDDTGGASATEGQIADLKPHASGGVSPVALASIFSLGFALLTTSATFAIDRVRVESKVDAAEAKYGVTGRNVVVAVLDRGIDWRHPDFRNTDGTTRIEYIYDLGDHSGAFAEGNPYGVGTIYTRAQINAALATNGGLPTRDALGHGTTTTGIAAGGGRLNAKYRGIAPDARIIAIKITSDTIAAHDGEPAEVGFWRGDLLPQVLEFVTAKAAELGMPCVMLLNVGTSTGPTDGTSFNARLVDRIVGPGISGLAFVTGTSDDGGVVNHAGGVVEAGQTIALDFEKVGAGSLTFDLWYPETDRFSVRVTTPAGTSDSFAAPTGPGLSDSQAGTHFSYSHRGRDVDTYAAANQKRQIVITFTGPAGAYRVELTGATVASGRFDATLNPAYNFGTSAPVNHFLNHGVPGSIWDMATAFYNICPNAYWVTNGQLWSGSGVGPTFDGRVGVDVSAPGADLFTTYAPKSQWATVQGNVVAGSAGYYGRAGAVSGANPIVTGIIALIMERHPNLDAAQIKELLQVSATADAQTGAVPNPNWGYGKVNALVALDAAEILPIEFGVQPSSVRVSRGYGASFSARATGPGAFTYQWQRSANGSTWEDLKDGEVYTGATSSTLKVFNVPQTADGHRLRIVITSGAKSVASEAAVLRVESNDGLFFTTIPRAKFSEPWGLVIDGEGNMFVADRGNHAIRKIAPDGWVSTFAGKLGVSGTADGSGGAARFKEPTEILLDSAGNLLVTDAGNHTIRKITPAGVVSTVAGTPGGAGSADGAAGVAQFRYPDGLAVDAAGNLYVSDRDNHTIRKISTAGVVSTIAGSAGVEGAVNGTGAAARFSQPSGIAVDGAGNLFVADYNNHALRKITPAGEVTTFAGALGVETEAIADGVGLAARFYLPDRMKMDADGFLLLSDFANYVIRKIDPSGNVRTVPSVSDGLLMGAAVDANGTIYATDPLYNRVRKLVAQNLVTTIAGVRGMGGAEDGGFAFDDPRGIDVGPDGSIYVSDMFAHVIAKVGRDGRTVVFAGSPDMAGFTDSSGSAARFDTPSGLAVDAAGTVYVADSNNHTIRKITAAGVVSTLAGSPGVPGTANGSGASARFNTPYDVAVDSSGNLYVADLSNHALRKISPAGVVTTLAGQLGTPGGIDGTGAAARLYYPSSVCVDPSGNIFVGENRSATLRKVTPAGVVTTFAGEFGATGSSDGAGILARFNGPRVGASDAAGNIYVADYANFTIRKITPAGQVSTIAGAARVPGDDDGIGTTARFRAIVDVALDADGYLVTAEANGLGNGRIRTTRLPLAIEPDPAPVAAKHGAAVTLALEVNATGAFNYQWQFRADGRTAFEDVVGATEPTYTIASTRASHHGSYRLIVSEGARFMASEPIQLSVTDVPAPITRLVAISTRSRAGRDDQTLIMGFVIVGAGSKQLVVRGVGPGLKPLGVSDALVDPKLLLYGASGVLEQNDNWGGSAGMMQTFARLGMSPGLSIDSKDSALVRETAPGVYTAHVTTGGEASGISLVEVYDGDVDATSRFAALATRTVAGSGENTLIAGVVLSGNAPKKLLIRGVGPSLVSQGVNANSVLHDPQLAVFSGGEAIAQNDNWSGTAELKNAFATVGLGSFDSDTSKDAALLVTLQPGVYTVHVSGVNDTSGVAMIEVYEMP